MKNTIYIGKSLPKEGVMANEIFTERPEEIITRLTEKYPLIGLLFVGAEEYGTAITERDTAGTARAQAYEQSKVKKSNES